MSTVKTIMIEVIAMFSCLVLFNWLLGFFVEPVSTKFMIGQFFWVLILVVLSNDKIPNK